MSSFVSSILHSSANKIESVSFGSKKNKSKQQQQQGDVLGSRLAMHASTPTLSNNTYYYHHPQRSHSTEYVPAAPPPYDTQLNLHHSSPVPSPSTSWTSEMSAFAEKIKDDVASSFKSTSNNKKSTSSSAIDRHSISQGMKLVSIAADEYEQGNESVALGIYLTGIDKILMALPNKTDMNTKMAIREKLLDVEERVGIINLATSQKKQQQQQQQQNNQPEDYSGKNIMTNTFLLSRIASTISTISTKAYQSTLIETNNENTPTVVVTSTSNVPMDTGDAMTKFKRFGQYVIQTTVTCAVLIKRSPLPDILSFLFGYLFQLMIWVDSEYHIMQKAQATSIQCLKFGLQANEQYRLHEFISEGLYMIFAAGLKATVAFNETPAYDVKQQPTAVMSVAPERVDPPKTCLPTVSQKAKSSPWVWSPW